MSQINIVGAGLAGLSAAVTLAVRGISCALLSAQPSERAQSVLAEGGINGALDLMGENDSVAEHLSDTLRGGCDLADPNAAAAMTAAAPDILRWLLSLGVPFNRENGRMIQRSFGGQRKRRTAYAKGSTGKILMTALIDEARKYEAQGLIRRYPHHQLTDLETGPDGCTGLTAVDSYSGALWRFPGPVILCTGGLNGLFPGMTTGSTANTGDAAALAFAKGAALANLEFIQYHPTTVQIPGKRLLISEAARGEGGRLYGNRGGGRWYFMEELYPELGNLMPRDVISREMVRVQGLPDWEGPVFLDMTGLSAKVWRDRLPDLREELSRYLGLDPAREPVPVSPGIHFFMGGIYVNQKHETQIPGLYAAGECACQYHGANRLGGNSMLGAIFGGQTAAAHAAERALSGGEPVCMGESPAAQAVDLALSQRLCRVLCDGLGIVRSQETLTGALEQAEALLAEAQTARELRRVQVGLAALRSALAREESRGAHTRTDFPARDDERFRRTTVARMAGGEIEISFQALPERRAEV